MKLLDDLYSSENCTITKPYSMYYESLDGEQSKVVVSAAIDKITSSSKDVGCDLGESEFTLYTK